MQTAQLASSASGTKATAGSGTGYNVRDFGATGDGTTDDTLAFERALLAGDTLDVPAGTYRIDLDLGSQRPTIRGAGMTETYLQPYTSGGAALTLGSNATWQYGEVRDLSFIGAAGTNVSVGVSFGHAVYESNDQYAGRMRFVNVRFDDLDIGVYKRYGNIGNRFTNCEFADCNYHYHAESYSSMHAGNDLFDGCHLQEAQLASIYIDSSLDGSGQTIFRGCIWELNPGFPLFVAAYENTGAIGILLEDCWGELNATTTPVTIHAVSYATRFAYLNNVRSGHFERVMINGQRLELAGYTTLRTRACIVGDIDTPVIQGANTVYIADDLVGDDIRVHAFTQNLLRVKRTSGNFLGHAVSPQRVKVSHKYASNVKLSAAGHVPLTWTGSASIATTTQADGLLYDACQELTFTGASQAESMPGSFDLTAGKFLAWSFEVKQVSGDAPANVRFAGVTRSVDAYVTTDWRTFAGVGEVVAGGHTGVQFTVTGPASGTCVLRFGAIQLLQFDTKQEAIEFLESRVFAVDQAEQGRDFWGAAAPTTGTWAVGDRVWNTAPAAGGTLGWVCTTAGTSGTWKTFGGIAA